MDEIIFIVKESPEGGFEARAVNFSIFVEGDTYNEIKENIKDAVHCHFDKEMPRLIRIHYTREEIFAA
jgi:predicted RNase H-like HicB family nuclease